MPMPSRTVSRRAVKASNAGVCWAGRSRGSYCTGRVCQRRAAACLSSALVGSGAIAMIRLARCSAATTTTVQPDHPRTAIEHIMSAAQLGNDPIAAFATTCDVQRRAFRATGALTGPVDSTLDPELVDVMSAIVSSGDLGFDIAPLGAVGDDASPLARLLDLTGPREH